MKRIVVFAYGVIAYVVFLATYLYAVGFVGNIGAPKSLDSAPTAPLAVSLAINIGLLALFALQHSIMARSWFKSALDPPDTAVGRAQHLRAGKQRRADSAVLAMAAAWRCGVVD